jgi:hypothetical protein
MEPCRASEGSLAPLCGLLIFSVPAPSITKLPPVCDGRVHHSGHCGAVDTELPERKSRIGVYCG